MNIINVIKQINPSNGCIVVAHPDDEVCWFGGLILRTRHIAWHIACCSYPRNKLESCRTEDFFSACDYVGVPTRNIIGAEEPHCRMDMDREKELTKYDLSRFDIVLTHGDWGHQHHKSIHRQVLKLYKGPIICAEPGGQFLLSMDDGAYADKIEWMKHYRANSVKVEGRDVEKWEALLYHHKYLRNKFERYSVHNTEKTLNIYNRSWKLTSGVECDIHLAEYIKERNITNKTIFHFGTGEHHKFGEMVRDNLILGITASTKEYDAYMRKAIENPVLAKRYKVLFADIYTLNVALLPKFDIVTLFHLCEYSRDDSDYGQMADRELLHMFLGKLNPDNLLCFFTKSNHYREAKVLIDECVREGTIEVLETYKSIMICRGKGEYTTRVERQ
jgi:hypothetical protein